MDLHRRRPGGLRVGHELTRRSTRPGGAGGIGVLPGQQEYTVFLLALFALAAGLSILETSANPFVISMGPMKLTAKTPKRVIAFIDRPYL
jgi:hypothetical protein